jgi:hypothetical protein
MASTKLASALQYWINADHTQKEFVEATGIDAGTVSLIFRGVRGLTLKQRAAVYYAFKERTDLNEALGWLVADLRDNVPPEVAEFIQVHLSDSPTEREGRNLSTKDAAVERFISLLRADDPSTVALVLSLDAFSQSQSQSKKPKK